MDTYFTFLDGAFLYDCGSCGQACCRGKGMALDASRELVPLLIREPRLAPLMSAIPGGLEGWADVTDGCWFLEDDGWCRIETTENRLAKPVTCRLFPFNRVFRVGRTQVIDFNSVICPLQDAEAIGRPGVTWRELLDDLEHVPDGPLTTSQAPLPAGAEGRWEPLERVIVEAGRDHRTTSAAAFAALQSAAAEAAVAGKPLKSLVNFDAALARMERLEEAWARFHGTPLPSADLENAAKVARGLALLGPSLRFNTIFRRNGPAWTTAVQRMPRLLLATAHLARIAASLAGRSGLRALTELHQNTAPLWEILARWDEPAIVASPPNLADAPEPLASAVRAAVEKLSPFQGPPRALGEVLEETWSGLPPPARSLALGLFARAGIDLRFDETRAA